MLKASGSERRGDDTHLFEKTTVVRVDTRGEKCGSVCVCARESSMYYRLFTLRDKTQIKRR